MPDPVLITTDLDRTLIFSARATRQLGGELPADVVEMAGGQAAGELCRAARDALTALPGHVKLCLATSRSLHRLSRLSLPMPVPYSIAANGGLLLVDGKPDLEWSRRIHRIVAAVAPAADIRAILHGLEGAPWLERLGEPDDMCVLAIVDRKALEPGQFALLADDCQQRGWRASLIGRKLYVFPAGFGKEAAASFVAERLGADCGVAPLRLAAGDTEHDRPMLEAADIAWVPAGSDLASAPAGRFRVTSQPGHAAAAQITREWLQAAGA
jgi:hydroxymethylpyrimidine pyrophosphatase-like HAD family hydrolase